MSRFKKILFTLFLLAVLIPSASLIVIQIPAIQTTVCNLTVQKLSEIISGNISVGKVYISLPNRLIIKDIAVTLNNGADTVASIGKVHVHIGATSLLTENARIHKVALDDGFVRIDRIKELTASIPKDTVKTADIAETEIPADTTETVAAPSDSAAFAIGKFSTISLDRLSISRMALSTTCNDTLKKPVDRVKRPRKVDWKEFSFTDINLDIRKIVVSDSITASIRKISAHEEHGWNVKEFNGELTLTDKMIHIDGLHYEDGYTTLSTNFLKMDFDAFSSFSDFCNKVAMDVDFTNTLLDFNTLSYFGCSDHLKLQLYVTGRVTGPIARIRSKSLKVMSGSKKTRLDLQTNIIGLPKAKETMASVKILELQTSMEDISYIVSQVTKSKNYRKENIARLAPGQTLQFTGSLDGQFTDFIAHGDLRTSSIGSVDVDIICMTDKVNGYTLDGYVNSHKFGLGEFIRNDKFGNVTFNSWFRMVTGRTQSISVEELHVDSFEYSGHDFNDIFFQGRVARKSMRFTLNSNDDWVKFGLNFNMLANNKDELMMGLEVDSLRFVDTLGLHYAGNISLVAESESSESRASIRSNLLAVDYASDTSLSTAVQHIKNKKYTGINSYLLIRLDKLQPLLDVVKPGLFVEPGTTISYEFTENAVGIGAIHSDLIAIGDTYVKGLNSDIIIDSLDRINMVLKTDSIQTGGTMIRSTNLNIDIAGAEEPAFSTGINKSRFSIGDVTWSVDSRDIRIGKDGIAVDSLRVSSGDHYVAVDGTFGSNEADTMKIRLHDIDLSLFKSILASGVNPEGTVNGYADLIAFKSEKPGCIADISADSIRIGGSNAGDFKLSTTWNQQEKMFDVSLVNIVKERKSIDISGSFKPEGNIMDITVGLDSLNLTPVGAFLGSAVSDMDGSISGKIHVGGSLKEPEITGKECRMNDVGFKLLFTQVPYTVSGPFSIDNNGIRLDGISLTDKEGNSGRLSGGLSYQKLKNVGLDARIELHNILGLNTTPADNESFYGKAYATGMVRIHGPLNALSLDINATTNDKTSVHIPISSHGIDQTSILTFKRDATEKMSSLDSLIKLHTRVKKKSQSKAMAVNLNLNATRDAEVQIEIDRSTGDILKTRGDGVIAIKTGGASSNLDIKGDYTVNSGSFKFTLVGGIISRDFKISQGGTISMNGDIMQSTLNMAAKYQTKASLSALIQDTTSSSARRTVDCEIGIRGMLSNPELAFNVTVPDLDPTTQGKVESALNTEEKRMKQVLALLLSGSFVPDEQGGIVNSTTVLYSNVSEIMSNQFNNIFRQLEIPLDLGFKYQPTNDGRDMFDVAVSTQLFNNRVKINGNIGNRQYSSSNQSDFAGDIDVEIKLNANGKVLLKLFSHSADQYSNYLDQAQRNGAGIVYQEEFDTFKELWRKMFWSKKRREEEIRKAIIEQQQNGQRQIISDTNPVR